MSVIFNNVTGAILAGGGNTRMEGKTKAFLTIGGKKIITSTLEKFDKLFDEIIIVANAQNEFNYLNQKYIVVNDEIKNIGPLGGIHSALINSGNEAVFITACDMPFINTDLICKTIDHYYKNNFDSVIPKISEKLEPLFAVYKKSLSKSLAEFISGNKNFYIRSFLNIINTGYLDLIEDTQWTKAFTNLNTPDDIKDLMIYE